MIRNIFMADHKGFSLLEMSCVLMIISILASSAIPALTRFYLERAADKTSLDMSAIEEGARAFFIDNGSWPASINALQSGQYLPAAWNAVNPFGHPYTTAVGGDVFTVSTQVMDGSQIAITSRLPVSSYTGTLVSSSIPPPGASTTGWGVPFSINTGQTYYAATDGMIQGLVYTYNNSISYQVYADLNNPPQTSLSQCQQGTYSSNNGGYVEGLSINCIIHKGSYYQVVPGGQANGSNLVFMPLGV